MTDPRVWGTLCLVLGGCAGGGRVVVPTTSPPPDWVELARARLPLLERCELPHVDEDALCGTIEVPEDRSVAGGRKIALNVVVVPATSETPPADPVFVFEGGPGGAATGRAVGSTFAGRVRARDIVLVDQRGTGDSNALDCDLTAEGADVAGRLRPMFPDAAVRACARELSRRADLLRYTSADHADDIEEVRRALGYGPLNIRGGSYGTHAMMVFAQRHPRSTRSLFGIGVDSPRRSNLAERGVLAERAVEGVAALCDREPECAAIAGSLGSRLTELLGRIDIAPRTVELADPLSPAERLTIEVGRDWLGEQLRLISYFAFTSRALPWAVHRAHHADDWEPLVQLAVGVERLFSSALATGVVLTVQCSEKMDFDVRAALERDAESLFGSYRLAQQVEGCSAWPHRRVPSLGVAEPAVLEIPALFLSGALDAVTPPEYAEDARTLFPNSAHVVIPVGQHGPFDLEGSWECVHGIWADFLDAGGVDGLDARCAEELRRPPFVLSAEGFSTYLTDVLGQL